MTTEIRTATFAGKTYRYVVYEPADILKVPGVERLKGFADHIEGAAHAMWGTFVDEAEVRERHWHLGPQDVVLDCGPAFGSYTMTAALQGATVIALEPSLFCRSVLAANLVANEELARRVTVLPIGVHKRSGVFDPDNAVFYADKDNAPPGTQLLNVSTIDEVLCGAAISVIKLDVEGAEYGALLGAVATLKRDKPRLLIEEHEFKDAGIGARCEALLRGLGYGAPVRVNHGSVDHSFYGRPQ